MLILPRKIRSQPQVVPRFSRDLPTPDVALLPSIGMRNFGKAGGDWTTTSGRVPRHTPHGLGQVSNGGTDGTWLNLDGTNNGQKFTILLTVFARNIVTDRSLFQWASTSASSGGPYVLIRVAPSNVLAVFWNGGYRISSKTNAILDNTLITIVLRGTGVSNPSHSIRLYANGEFLGSSTLAGSTTTRTRAWFGNGYPSSLLDAATLFGAIWNGVDIGDAHAQRLSTDPWALFQSHPRRLWTVTSGGATLYTLTADPATSTGTIAPVSLLYNRVVSAAQATCVGQLQDVTLQYTSGYTLSAEGLTFSGTGLSATLLYNRVLSAAQATGTGSLADVTLTHESGTIYTLSAEAGSSAYSLGSINLLYNRVFSAEGAESNGSLADVDFALTNSWSKDSAGSSSWTKNSGLTHIWS